MNDKILDFESLKPLKGLSIVKTAEEVKALDNKSRAMAAAKARREAPLKNNQLARQLKGLKSLILALNSLED